MHPPTQRCPHLAPLLIAAAGTAALSAGCRQQPAPTSTVVQASTPIRQISVNGIATMEVNPDVVDLSLTLSVVRASPKPALTTLRAEQTKLVEALKEAGVAETDLRLGHIDVSPRYRPHPNSHLVDGYEASVTLVITLHDFDELGDVMEAAARHGVSRMYTRFRSTELAAKKKEVRELALQATRDKARQIATSMKVELGEVLTVAETGITGGLWGAVGNENVYAPARPGQKLQPGAIELSLTLEATYALN
jgi:uncharacterized protein YggE